MTGRHPFTDPVSGRECTLITAPGSLSRVKHPGCPALADVSPELDAFYCRSCGWNGRVSGAWALDMAQRDQRP